jgi:ribose transport system substrate-binding protein
MRTVSRGWGGKRSLVFLVAFALVAVACGSGDQQEDADGGGGAPGPGELSEYSARVEREKQETVDTSQWRAEPPYTVGFTSQGTFNGFGLMLDAAFRWAVEESDQVAEVVGTNGDGDPNKQIAAMEDMIQSGVDIIVIQPLGQAALSAPVDRAIDAGIPVVTCLDSVQSDSYVSRVDVDLYAIAFEVTRAMAEDMGGQGKAAIFSGIAGVDAAEIWTTAATDALSQFPDIEIVATEFSDWSVANAKSLMTQVLSREGQIDGFFAGGAENAIGAIQAIEEAGAEMPVFGVTNPLNGFLRLALEHDIEFTAAPDPPGTSPLCLETALKVLNGEAVQKFVDIAAEVDGAGIFDESEAEERYDEQYNDEYTFPTLLPHEELLAAGFGRA